MVEEQVDVEYLSLSMDASEYTFRHRSTCRTPGESEKEYPTSGKEYIETPKTRQDEGTSGGEQVCYQDQTCLWLVGELKQGV